MSDEIHDDTDRAGDVISPDEPELFVDLPTPLEVSPITGPGDLTAVDRRNDLDGLEMVPTLAPVGLIDASTDASTTTAQVVVADDVEVALDTFVVSAQRLTDGVVLFHYGIVVEVSGRVEGAELATDTARFLNSIIPGQRFRRAEVRWLRTIPERQLPPASGAPMWVAEGEHRRRALFLDKMSAEEALPIGLDMNDEPVYMPYTFLNGDRGAHASISGKSGVATKTSYALFLLYMLFETDAGVRARGASSHDRSLVFSVKGSDLCLLDKPNNQFVDGDEVGEKAMDQWGHLIGNRKPGPFTKVAVYAPAAEGDGPPTADISVRGRSETEAYGWTPAEFVSAGLLQYLFDDLDKGQLSFIEQVVRTKLLSWAWPVEKDQSGKVVLISPAGVGHLGGEYTERASWDANLRDWRSAKSQDPAPAGHGIVVSDLDDLVEFISSKVLDTSPDHDPTWIGGVAQATVQAFVRRLWKATPRLRRLVGPGLARVGLDKQVSVVDVHALHDDAQRFVVAAVLDAVWADHEDSTAKGRTFVVLDELNKYAPRQGGSPIRSLLVDIAARGRSLGVILIGAQQNPSGVDLGIINNAALEVVGQIKGSESSELGWLPPAMRARAQIIAPGTMITSQPLLPAPVPIRFPFPPYATRASEVAGSPEDDADAARALSL